MTHINRSFYRKGPWKKFKERIFCSSAVEETLLPNHSVLEYLESSYPPNHNYVLENRKLIPLKKLKRRYGDIVALYPSHATSFLDITCSKGFFVFDALLSLGFTRAMGIDVVQTELDACEAVKRYLGGEAAIFKRMRLHELASRVEEFGGPFDVVPVINCYQYLYFGSKHFSGAYMSHDKIFSDLRKVCDGRVVFSNRLEVGRLQDYPLSIAKSADMQEVYDEQTVFEAAQKYFNVSKIGKLGRYPLWAMDAK